MRASFRRQAQQIRLAVTLAVLGGTGLGALGAFTLWQGWRLAADERDLTKPARPEEGLKS